LEAGILKVVKNAEIQKIPMADGGEGTVEAMITATGGKVVTLEVTGPIEEKVAGILWNFR
jgi:glycerate kinase